MGPLLVRFQTTSGHSPTSIGGHYWPISRLSRTFVPPIQPAIWCNIGIKKSIIPQSQTSKINVVKVFAQTKRTIRAMNKKCNCINFHGG